MTYKETYRNIKKIKTLFYNTAGIIHGAALAKRLIIEINQYKRTAPDNVLNSRRLYLNKLESDCKRVFNLSDRNP